MSYTPLRTDYTDAHWEGDKKYVITDNKDGTHGIQDVTEYGNKEKSFFGALDANTINGALNEYVLKTNFPEIIATAPIGSTVTCSDGINTFMKESESGEVTFRLPGYNTWTLTATLNDKTSNTETVIVDTVKIYSVTLTFFAATLTVNVTSGAQVTVTDGVTTFTETSNGTAVFTLPNAATWNVTAMLNSQTVSGSVVVTTATLYSMTLAFTLEGSTWEQIAAISASGNIPWQIGDEKNITLTNGEVLTLQIFGIKHDNLQAGGKAGITFGMKNCMNETRQMNSSNTNAGGFTGSAMYTWLTGTLKYLLPADLRAVMKTVNKNTSAGNDSSVINTDPMDIFLFAEAELFDTITYSKPGEGQKYPIFTDDNSRIKKLTNGAGAVTAWWERSPRSGDTTGFCIVVSDGTPYYYSASLSRGVVAGFCV